ncbi:MAG: ankyrin repeat domain-containing protein [Xenococcaceae cyanobacterium MO_188.B19]|nr:ankyrin repeat domain-containing protein [Xenococcaceae cyanobacterium MO_188.B19]
MLLDADAEINIANEEITPISAAATRGYLQVMEYLLDLGANPEIKNEDGDDALDFADLYDQNEALELLKKYTGKLDWKSIYDREE